MEFHDAEFLGSAKSKSQFIINNEKQLICCGRSNVGKSSLINALCNRKKLAYVGNTPGKTRLLNFFEIDKKFILVDAPGYGFANRSQKELIEFGRMMDDYFEDERFQKTLLLIVDMRHKPTKDDVDMINYAKYHKIKIITVATKYDKVKASQRAKLLKEITATLEIPYESIITVSSETKYGIDKLWNIINEAVL